MDKDNKNCFVWTGLEKNVDNLQPIYQEIFMYTCI